MTFLFFINPVNTYIFLSRGLLLVSVLRVNCQFLFHYYNYLQILSVVSSLLNHKLDLYINTVTFLCSFLCTDGSTYIGVYQLWIESETSTYWPNVYLIIAKDLFNCNDLQHPWRVEGALQCTWLINATNNWSSQNISNASARSPIVSQLYYVEIVVR